MKPKVGFLLDTNVVSEIRKKRPHPNLIRFFHELLPERTYLSVLTLGELRLGAARQAKRNAQEAQSLSKWIDGLEEQHMPRILPVDLDIARIWGEFSADRSRAVVDTLLAATAMQHQLTLVTRNTRDIADTPVVLHNPWLS